jgi:hypothetical protein
MWLRDANLNPDPSLPAEVTKNDRYAHNWRPLIAIADAASLEWGAEARAAAVALRDEYRDENLLVTLLRHLHDIFAAGTSDRLLSKNLCEALIAMEDAPYGEWRGVLGNAPPRPITQAQLAAALRPFGIRPRTIWMARAERTFKGYYRNQFEAAWRDYAGIGPDGGDAGEGEQAESRKSPAHACGYATAKAEGEAEGEAERRTTMTKTKKKPTQPSECTFLMEQLADGTWCVGEEVFATKRPPASTSSTASTSKAAWALEWP